MRRDRAAAAPGAARRGHLPRLSRSRSVGGGRADRRRPRSRQVVPHRYHDGDVHHGGGGLDLPGLVFIPHAQTWGRRATAPSPIPEITPSPSTPRRRKLTIWSTEAMALSRRRSSSFSAEETGRSSSPGSPADSPGSTSTVGSALGFTAETGPPISWSSAIPKARPRGRLDSTAARWLDEGPFLKKLSRLRGSSSPARHRRGSSLLQEPRLPEAGVADGRRGRLLQGRLGDGLPRGVLMTVRGAPGASVWRARSLFSRYFA